MPVLLKASARLVTSETGTWVVCETWLPSRVKLAVAVMPPGGVPPADAGAVTVHLEVTLAPGASEAKLVGDVALELQPVGTLRLMLMLVNVIACSAVTRLPPGGLRPGSDAGGAVAWMRTVCRPRVGCDTVTVIWPGWPGR